MTTFIQSVSSTSVATLSPLYVWGSLSQVDQARLSSLPSPSAITTFGTSSTSAPLTYDTVNLLQTLQPFVSASGLSAAQQQQLATALGLNANTTGAELLDAINTLLMPADLSQALVNVLVGDIGLAATQAQTPVPSLLNDQGGITGVPGDSTSRVWDTVLATISDLGASGVITNPASTNANNARGLAENQPAASTAQALPNPAPDNTRNVAESTTAASTNPVANNAQGATGAATTYGANQAASNLATTNPVVVTGIPVTTQNPLATELNPVAAAAAGTNAATTRKTLAADNTTPASPRADAASSTAGAAGAAAATILATVTTTATTEATATVAADAALQAARNLPDASIGNSPTASIPATVAGEQTTAATAAADNVTSRALTPLTGEAVSAVGTPPAARATSATAAVTNPPPIRFDNANSVLQSLLADAVAHALTRSNPASAYSVAGAVYQMGSGIDHSRQADLKGHFPDIRNTVGPVSRVAAVRGTTERQS